MNELTAKLINPKRLDINGYLFYKSFNRVEKTYWDCKKLRDKQCRARAVTIVNTENEIVVIKGPDRSPHSHAPNRNEVKAEEIITSVIKKADENPERPPSAIIRDEIAGTSGATLSQLPERENMKRMVRRARAKNLPPNPKSLTDLEELPERYQATLTGDKFLLYDSKTAGELDNGRVLVFATKRNLEILQECNMWFSDGTFKVTPNIFTQVFTILGSVPSTVGVENSAKVVLPLIYALLSSKEEEQYRAVYNAIRLGAEKFNIRGCEPEAMMSDFEKAIINAASQTFPNSDIRLCFFHLKQSIYRKVQQLGLQEAYNDINNSDVQNFCHMMASLAYVPASDVKATFRELKGSVPENEEYSEKLIELMKYFEKTYVGGRGIRCQYNPLLWNLYEATLAGEAATNNASEGWHNRFVQMLGKHHPDLYSLLNAFQKEQGDTEISILELRMGRKVKAAPKKKWIDSQARIKNVVESYASYSTRVLEYLKNVSYNISF